MSSQFPISEILQIQQISQYKAIQKRNHLTQLKSGSLIGNLPELLYMEGDLLLNMNTLNPTGSTIRSTAEYVLSLCSGFLSDALTVINNLSGSLPVITGPTNQSVNVGQTATFSVSVAGVGPFQYQWFRGAVLIPGATSSSVAVPNAQLTDNASTFFVQVTNATGNSVSGTATLTVTASITGFLYYNAADPGPTLQANSDPFSYQQSYSITHNANISVAIPSGATPNMFLIFKIPSGESAKTTWANGALNFGNFPDSVFQTPITFGGFTYYYTRLQASMDSTTPFVMS